MPTNYERVLKRFIPAFRLNAAKLMVDNHGLTQQHAAEILGTTQAAVSKYLKEDPNKYSEVKIDSVMLEKFYNKTTAKDTKGAQRVMCTMCQGNKKFDCAFIVK